MTGPSAPGVPCPVCGEWNLIITAEIESDILGAVADSLGTLPGVSEYSASLSLR